MTRENGNNEGWAMFGKLMVWAFVLVSGCYGLYRIVLAFYNEGEKDALVAMREKNEQKERTDKTKADEHQTADGVLWNQAEASRIVLQLCLKNEKCKKDLGQMANYSYDRKGPFVELSGTSLDLTCIKNGDTWWSAQYPLTFDGTGELVSVGAPKLAGQQTNCNRSFVSNN